MTTRYTAVRSYKKEARYDRSPAFCKRSEASAWVTANKVSFARLLAVSGNSISDYVYKIERQVWA